MIKHNFKKGDKVKLKDPKGWSISNHIGKIVGFDMYVWVCWDKPGNLYKRFPHLVRELEHAIKIGQQLEFGFMKGD